MQGRRHKHPARIHFAVVHVQLLVHHRIVQADYLAIHFHRVRQQDGILINAQHSLGEAGFSVSGGSVDEDRILRNQSRTQLIQHMVGDHQVGKRRPQNFAVNTDLCGLQLRSAVIIL